MSQNWRLKVQNQGIGCTRLSDSSRAWLFLVSSSFWYLLADLGAHLLLAASYQQHSHPSLTVIKSSFQRACPLLCPNFPTFIRIPVRLGSMLKILIWIDCICNYFQIKTHSEVVRVRTSTYLLGGIQFNSDTSQPPTNMNCRVSLLSIHMLYFPIQFWYLAFAYAGIQLVDLEKMESGFKENWHPLVRQQTTVVAVCVCVCVCVCVRFAWVAQWHTQHRRGCSNPWVRKIPWRRKWQPTPLFLPGKSHRQRNLEGYSP